MAARAHRGQQYGGMAAPDTERRRLLVLVVLLVAVAGVLSWVIVAGAGGTSVFSSRGAPAALAPRTSAAGSVTRVLAREPNVNWGDYVVVDSVVGQELTVHTTRGEGHDPTPYHVLIVADTIVNRSDLTTTIGVYEDVKPGDQFYFVGTALTREPPNVQAIRIFPFDQ
jgi:hypothetical protein